MELKDIYTLHRFVGAVEGVAVILPEDAQSLLHDYIKVVDAILDKEEKAVMGE